MYSGGTLHPHLIFAAGGILVDKNRVAIVHRPKYDDWTLPKGKLHKGESFETAAVREVHEETFCEPQLNNFAGAIHYTVKTGYKLVLFWHMQLINENVFVPNSEIDAIKWLKPSQLKKWLDYESEKELIQLHFTPGQYPNQGETAKLLINKSEQLKSKKLGAGISRKALDILDLNIFGSLNEKAYRVALHHLNQYEFLHTCLRRDNEKK